MHSLRALAVVGLLGCASPVLAQTTPVDGPARIVSQLEVLARNGGPGQLGSLISPSAPADHVAEFELDFFVPGVTRTVARERDRVPLAGVPEGTGFSLIVEFFAEVGARARIVSARVDISRSRENPEAWEIVDIERLSVVEGLYELRMDTSRGYGARNLTIDSEDFRLTLIDGSAFLVESDGGVTGMVLVGRGEMRFTPPSATEKGQLRIFAGSDNLVTSFETAYVRFSPSEYLTRVSTDKLMEQVVDRRIARRAEEVFERERPRSYSLDLADVSRQQWFLLPPAGDFLSEVRTRRFGTITYSKSGNQAEDISLFNRERRRTMSIYASADKLAERGQSYNEDDLADFDVTAYELDVELDPDRETLSGRARITLRSKSPVLSALTLRLAETLNVSSVVSPELGQLLFFRVRNQNGLLVNLPRLLPEGVPITLVVTYGGRVTPQQVDAEGVLQSGDDFALVPTEPSFLLSNRAYWYPQNSASDYATARLRVTVPDGYRAVASGQLVTDERQLGDLLAARGEGRTMIFAANQPARYFSVIVSRFVRVVETSFEPGRLATTRPSNDRIQLAVEANSRQVGRGRSVAATTEDVMRFYGSLMNDTPYPAMTIGVVESELPGGHSPAYTVMLNTPPPTAQFLWRNDPASFLGFPEFFMAHELAHQWWGQAVGWSNYHEQWLSEGFAQYFSALYAQKIRGDGAFNDMIRQFRRWAIGQSEQGPVYLGYRLGHVKSDSRVFRALVYNKGALVLHMLRRLVGDQVFFDGLRAFYDEHKFQKAGTPDLQRAFERASDRSLTRFFDRWIYGAEIPRIRYATTVTGGEVVVRFEQDPDKIFDVPVTVTISYTDGTSSDTVIPISSAREEQRLKTTGTVRNVQINRDSAALAEFDGL